ncbi:MAG: toprim domain-containing protein [Desulfamplus sp.]|nr:toprim domain-containing protein [Desulfamplus sp.]
MLKKEVVESLKNSMVQAGLTAPTTIEESKIIRFSTDGGNNKNGWYILNINDDGNAFWSFGDWKKGCIVSGRYTHDGVELTPAQHQKFDEEVQKMHQKIEQEQQVKHAAAKIKAAAIWSKAQEADPTHPYIIRKRISPIGMRQLKNTLVVPIYGDIDDSEDAPVSLQFINEDGEKRFLSGGKVAGGLHCIGDTTSSRIIYIAEGFATGSTINEATGNAVVVAFNAGNMQAVCEKIKTEFPDKKLVVAADNDLTTEAETGKNRGRDTAIAIFDKLGIEYVLCPINSDFNDLFTTYTDQEEGYEAVIQSLSETNNVSIYSKIVDEFNAEYAVTWMGSRCAVLKEELNPHTGCKDIDFTSEIDLKKYFANRVVPNPDDPKKEMCIVDYWLKSPDRRQYKKVVFEPGRDMPGYYNLWTGFPVEPKQGDWSLFRDHIFNIIVNGKESEFKWVMDWIARMVQDPGGDRPGVAIVLRGNKGTGKGIFVNTIGRLLGSHYLQLAQQNHLVGRFNHHLKNKILVFADEGFFAGDKQSEGAIKHMITEPELIIESKGKDAITVRNCINLVIASNNNWVVPAGEKERRFYVTEISNAKQQNHEYFKAISDQMRNGGLEAMLYDLLRWKYDFQHLLNPPRTEALLEQIEYSMSTIEKFWYSKLQDGALHQDHADWRGEISCKEFHDHYLEFATTVKERFPIDSNNFGKQLRKLCNSVETKKINSGGLNFRIYRFPTLEQCREEFEGKLGMTNIFDLTEESPQ